MDSCSIFVVTVIVSLVAIGVIAWVRYVFEQRKVVKMAPDDRSIYLENQRRKAQAAQSAARDVQHGRVSSQIICPQCQSRGKVRTKSVTKKKGISGGKATAALLTAGTSLLATGLSRKERTTEAHCDNCGSTWHF